MKKHIELLEFVKESVDDPNNDECYEFQSISFKSTGLFKLLELLKDYVILDKRYECLVENLLERRADNWKEGILIDQGPKTMS